MDFLRGKDHDGGLEDYRGPKEDIGVVIVLE